VLHQLLLLNHSLIKVVLVPACDVGFLTSREAMELEIGGMMGEMGQMEVVMLDPSSGRWVFSPSSMSSLTKDLHLQEKRIPYPP
jgi:hypothetical protein